MMHHHHHHPHPDVDEDDEDDGKCDAGDDEDDENDDSNAHTSGGSYHCLNEGEKNSYQPRQQDGGTDDNEK